MEIKFEDYDRQLNEYVEEAIDGVVENIMDVHYSHVTVEDERKHRYEGHNSPSHWYKHEPHR